MTRLPGDNVLDALAQIGTVKLPDGSTHEPGVRVVDGAALYSAAYLSDEVESYARPDELEVRRRQRELEQRDMTRRGGGRR